jgi:hypothetical protein
MYASVIAMYEEKQRVLVAENEELRDSLKRLARELQCTLNAARQSGVSELDVRFLSSW